jgi:hypothetical protein
MARVSWKSVIVVGTRDFKHILDTGGIVAIVMVLANGFAQRAEDLDRSNDTLT